MLNRWSNLSRFMLLFSWCTHMSCMEQRPKFSQLQKEDQPLCSWLKKSANKQPKHKDPTLALRKRAVRNAVSLYQYNTVPPYTHSVAVQPLTFTPEQMEHLRNFAAEQRKQSEQRRAQQHTEKELTIEEQLKRWNEQAQNEKHPIIEFEE